MRLGGDCLPRTWIPHIPASHLSRASATPPSPSPESTPNVAFHQASSFSPNCCLHQSVSCTLVIMSSTRIYHNISRKPFVSTVVLFWANYELYRIHRGTHPYWSPRLEAAGLLKKRNKTPPAAEGGSALATTSTTAESGVSGFAITWTNLNGVPIPTLESLSRSFRKD
jgi:hypothetical protein